MMKKSDFVAMMMEKGEFQALQYLMLGIDPEKIGFEFDVSELGDEYWSGALHFVGCCVEAKSYLKDEFVSLHGKDNWLTNRSVFDSWVASGCKGLCSKGIESFSKVRKIS